MSGSIRLHPQHGVNPTMPVCFFCGEETGEIALLGAAYRGEAPRHMVLSYEPCAKCKGHMAKGITLIEGGPNPIAEGQQPIQKHPMTVYPTGTWAVITERLVREAIKPAELAEKICQMRKCFVEPGTLEALGIKGAEHEAGHA